MKIDANDKYDVIDIVSNISSQVTDNKENIIKDSPFSVILENTLKYDDVQSLQEKVATSGKSLPLSLTTDDRESVTYNQNILSALAESSGENTRVVTISPPSADLSTILDRGDSSTSSQTNLDKNDEVKMRTNFVNKDHFLFGEDSSAPRYPKLDLGQALANLDDKEFNKDNLVNTPKIIIKNLNDKRPILLGSNFQDSSVHTDNADHTNLIESNTDQPTNKIAIKNSNSNDSIVDSITANTNSMSGNDKVLLDKNVTYDRFYQKYNYSSQDHNDNSGAVNHGNEIQMSNRIASQNVARGNMGDKPLNSNAEKYLEISNEISKSEKLSKSDLNAISRTHNINEEFTDEIDVIVVNKNIENNITSKTSTNVAIQASQRVFQEFEKNSLDVNDAHQAGTSNSSNEPLSNLHASKYVDYLVHNDNVLDLSKFVSEGSVSEEGRDLSPRNIFGKFVENISSSVTGLMQSGAQGTYKFTTNLHPENLGSLEVNIEYSEEHGIKINLISENVSTAEILKENASSLKNNISNLNSIELNISSNEGNYGGESQKQLMDQAESDPLSNKEQDLMLMEEVDEANVRIDPISPYNIDKLV